MKEFKIPFMIFFFFLFPESLFSQPLKPWLVRVEVGRAENHCDKDLWMHYYPKTYGGVVAAHFGRSLGANGFARLDAGLMVGIGDPWFSAGEGGFELRLAPHSRVTPWLGGGVGYIVEPEWAGEMLRVAAGIELNFSTNNAFRLSLQRGKHGDACGPHLITLGFEHKFGGRKK